MKEIIESYFRERSLVNHQLASYNDCIPGDGRVSRMERIVRGIRIGSDDPLEEVPGGEESGGMMSVSVERVSHSFRKLLSGLVKLSSSFRHRTENP